MGYAISWIALKDKTIAQATDLLALAPSGKYEEAPHSMFLGVSLDTGWYVIYINKSSHKLVSERNLQRISASGEVVAAVIEEHVMFSSAESWKNGSMVWKISHAAESGIDHLQEAGILPPKYHEIKNRLVTAQKQESRGQAIVDHVFDVPLELAESIVGYKHDKNFQTQFEILT